MNEQEIRDLIQSMIDNDNATNQFAVSDTSFHTHNGADSPKLKFTNQADTPSSYYQKKGYVATVNATETGLEFDKVSSGYVGYVNSGGGAGSLPTGWSSSKTGTGAVTLTHNLGTANYSCVAICVGTNNVINFNAVNANDVQFVIQDPKTENLQDATFYFILLPF